MNKNIKVALGVIVGLGLIYLGYKYFVKGGTNKGGISSNESLVHDKANREVILVQNKL
jgi:hypothetical protein